MMVNNRLTEIIIMSSIIVFAIVTIELLILPNRMNTSNMPKCPLISEDFTQKPSKDTSNVVKESANLKMDAFKFQDENVGEFKNWGTKTDKTFTHHYETMYGQLLGPFRNRKLKFMEIGLGCGDHGGGPGHSLRLWRKYLPQANISIFEYDEKCALEFKNQVENLFIGDSGDLNLLQSIGEKYGPFDFIVDDGGHTRKSQINGLVGFWPHMTSKGVYVIEDIYLSTREDRSKSSLDLIFQILLLFNEINSNYINFIRDEIPVEKFARDIVKDLMSIQCYSHACAFIKK